MVNYYYLFSVLVTIQLKGNLCEAETTQNTGSFKVHNEMNIFCPVLQETPYPNDESLQKSLQDKVNWDAYRRKTLKTLVRELPTKQRKVKDLLVHKRTRRDMSLGEDLKEAIRKIQRKDDET